MKAIFIPTLFLFSFLNSQGEDITNDVIQYGFNYTGDLKDGKRHGNGKYIYPNGDIYDGEWINGIREGEGTFTLNEGDVVYQPPEIHHREIKHSDDLELIEITSPAEFETVSLNKD